MEKSSGFNKSKIVVLRSNQMLYETCFTRGGSIVKKVFDIKNPMAPPWLMYSHISSCSIGWRMGYGENYIMEFWSWYSDLTRDEQKQFQQMFPTPKGWLEWYEDDSNEDFYSNVGILLWNKNGNMKYSNDRLQKDHLEGKVIEYLFFWGHQSSNDANITKTCLSQWWKADFNIDTNHYCCMEQYMMAEKARLFDDSEILDKILKNNDPKQIKDLGRKVKNFSEDIWKQNRYSIILNGNYAKFLQNENLKQFLIQSEDKVIVEASPYDKIWGIGLSIEDKKIFNPLEWKGENLLGFALMEVRDEIVRVYKNQNKLNLKELHEIFD